MNKNSLKNLTYNHVPLSKEFIIEEFKKQGYEIINYTYKNNLTRMSCYDKEGYKVMISYSSLSKNVKQYQRFSTTCNEENFLYNVDLYIKKNNLTCKVLEWRKSKTKNHIDIKCQCECGEIYWCDFNYWRRSLKDRCNKCVNKLSNIAREVKNFLDENQIKYIQEYRFNDCRNINPLPFDFYLIDYNICLEIDGEQHYYEQSMRYFKNGEFSKENFKKIKKNDNIKNKYCKDNNIKLIRLKYNKIRNKKYKTFLLNEIYNN